MFKDHFFYVTLTIACIGVWSVESKVLSSIDKVYKKGVSAYSGERWTECITQFEESLYLYKLYKSVAVNCRLKCRAEPYETYIKENIEDLKIYEKFLNKRKCLLKCLEKGFDDVRVSSDVHESTLFNIQARKPYEYLHLCYFQMYAFQKAASAAYTFLIANPKDETMKNNLKYYSEQPEVDINEVVDLESEDYKVLYHLGLKSYKKNNWAETVASMEEVLTDYMSSENVCRAECERQPEQESTSEFVLTVSNNVASLLHCHQHCQEKLKSLEYNSGIEFLADVLNYLQISYYHLDRFEDAAKAVASYLALMPDDEDMLENKKMYSTLTDAKSFSERETIIYYMNRDLYEKKLIELFHQEFNDYHTQSNAV
ncbi:cartilage-associated protein-like [Ostrinia furnacalis]|uniref:cartilage-associated protein-like n=1 Tax=Ostrinia furnacalis TaxID=93504 RepID=UPI00103D408C|nr:cartilage-associated protein-like [Ostrinia furnacalis]